MKKTRAPLDELLHESAYEYLYAHARFCMYDNSDDMHDEDFYRRSFENINSKLPQGRRNNSIVDYILKNLPEEIQKAKDAASEISGGEWDPRVAEFLDGKA